MFKILQSLYLIILFVKKAFPAVKQALSFWHKEAQKAEPALAKLAVDSIADKRFHCLGGSIYALYNGTLNHSTIHFIVALQTISDYLDNLCDRAGISDEKAFRQLHLSMTDALSPGKQPENYYRYYPYKEDGGYLNQLVAACQEEVAKLPQYSLVKNDMLKLANLYSELQTYKHLDPNLREEKIKLWISPYLALYPQLSTWEFAAATGSTLGIFILFSAAADNKLTANTLNSITEAYFPWVSALHILLDYYIDETEDQTTGDLNFVYYYTDKEDIPARLLFFWQQALLYTQKLPDSTFHYTILSGLLAMYLSDPKTLEKRAATRQLLKTAGKYPVLLYHLCKILRKKKIL